MLTLGAHRTEKFCLGSKKEFEKQLPGAERPRTDLVSCPRVTWGWGDRRVPGQCLGAPWGVKNSRYSLP